ncbi:MAG: hypothetical protein LBP52_10245 [Burkholderiaceae bacterium]|jgi:hypothetical protein|nr:hypothetical protein [Burkholderiaceae bacterium]
MTGLEYFSAIVGGTRNCDQKADIYVSAGTDPNAARRQHLTWGGSELQPAQVLRITMRNSGKTNLPGQTLEEMDSAHPGADAEKFLSPPSLEEVRACALLWDVARFRIRTSAGLDAVFSTTQQMHGYQLALIWVSLFSRPDTMRFSASGYTLEDVMNRNRKRTNFAAGQLGHDQWIEFELLEDTV